jgi:hypothetical protein
VPEIAAGASGELEPLRAACRAALAHLTGPGVDTVTVVGGDTRTFRHVPPFGGSLAPWGLDVPVGTPGGAPLPLSLLIGAWLLPEATSFVSVATDATTDECAVLGAELVADGRVGLLVMGDGSARRSEKAPGYTDPRAEPFDRAVADALAKGDTEALLALDPALAAELMAAGRAPWQVLAGAGTRDVTELLYHEAPHGVGYFVASWR